jgi:hypothetical protein
MRMFNYNAFQLIGRNSQSSHVKIPCNEEDVEFLGDQPPNLFSQCLKFVEKIKEIEEIVEIKEKEISQPTPKKRGQTNQCGWQKKKLKDGG